MSLRNARVGTLISTRYYEKQERKDAILRSEEMNHKENGFSLPPPSVAKASLVGQRCFFSRNI